MILVHEDFLKGYCPVSRAALLGVHTGRVYSWLRILLLFDREYSSGITGLNIGLVNWHCMYSWLRILLLFDREYSSASLV
jgi:hypothetical protein